MPYEMILYRGGSNDRASSRITRTRATTSNSVRFNPTGGDYVDGGSAFIEEMPSGGSRYQTPTANVGSDDPEIQDSGYRGTELHFVLHFENTATAENVNIDRLNTWLKESSETTTYPNGRFGFWCRRPTIYNQAPTADKGYYLHEFKIYPSFELYGVITGEMTLRLGERPT